MKVSKISTVVSSAILAMAVSGNGFAAENTEGVKEHFSLMIEKFKTAQAAAAAGDKDLCVKDIKQGKQHYKEITGDAAGKPLQDAIKVVKVAQADCSAGETAKAAETLTGVVADVTKIFGSL